MKKIFFTISIAISTINVFAQVNLTPEVLLQMGKVNALGVTKDGKSVVYSVRTYNLSENKKTTQVFIQPVIGGKAIENAAAGDMIPNNRISSDGKMSISSADVKVKNIFGKDVYPDLAKSDVNIYEDLNYRHWDTWEDGSFGHIFINYLNGSKVTDSLDIMPNKIFITSRRFLRTIKCFIWHNIQAVCHF